MREVATTAPPAAEGSSFYLAMRILPGERRKAMYALYDFCRAVDDIADGGGPHDRRLSDLDRWRTHIGSLFAADPPAKLDDLAEAVRRFGLRQADFNAVIDGMAMDAAGDIRDRIKAGILVGERRWTLQMDSGLEVELPETGAVDALGRLATLERQHKLLEKDVISLDLRVPGRITARLSEDAAAQRAEMLAKKTKKANPT